MRWFFVIMIVLLVVNLAALVLYHLLWDAVERSEPPETVGPHFELDLSPAPRGLLARGQAHARQRAK